MKQAAGIVLYRTKSNVLEVLLVHPGGPFWSKKDSGAWSIPKGEFDPQEEALSAAKREFKEELGSDLPEGKAVELGQFKVTSSKQVTAWALEGDLDAEHVKSNLFEMEWPPKSGQMQEFPEADKAGWFPLAVAVQKIVKGQVQIVEKLAEIRGVEVSVQVAPVEEAKTKAATDKEQTSLF